MNVIYDEDEDEILKFYTCVVNIFTSADYFHTCHVAKNALFS